MKKWIVFAWSGFADVISIMVTLFLSVIFIGVQLILLGPEE